MGTKRKAAKKALKQEVRELRDKVAKQEMTIVHLNAIVQYNIEALHKQISGFALVHREIKDLEARLVLLEPDTGEEG